MDLRTVDQERITFLSNRPTHHNIAYYVLCLIFRLRRMRTVPLSTAARRLTSLVVLQVALDSRQTPLSWTLASPAQRMKTCTALAAERPTPERSLLAASTRTQRHHKLSRSILFPSTEFDRSLFSSPRGLFHHIKKAQISSVSGRVSFQ